jgi:anti-sigma factor RsiW
MTDRHEPAELPVDLLADLDAGQLDHARAAEVRAVVAQDPEAAAVLAALTATRAELGELADPPVPAEYAARWDAALAEASSDPAPAPRDPATPGPPPGRRRRRVRPALAAAAVLAAAVAGGVVSAPPEPAPLSLDGVDLATAGLAVRGDFDVGDLADPVRRAGCLRAVAPSGVAPDAPLLGGRDVVLDGRHGVLLLLAAGGRGRLHVVVVEPGCGPDGGVLLGALTIGG